MINIKDVKKNELLKIIIGIICGFGLSCIFGGACNGRNCIIYKAPNPKDIENNIYKHNERCYTYETVDTECNEDSINV